MITIGPASSRDIETLIALDPGATVQNGRIGQIRQWVSVGQCHIARQDGEAAGYMVSNRSFFHRPFIELVFVNEAFRRRGIGRALVDHASALWPRDEVWSSTNQSNAAMQALFLGVGFVQSGVIENLDPGDPELIFRRSPAHAGTR